MYIIVVERERKEGGEREGGGRERGGGGRKEERGREEGGREGRREGGGREGAVDGTSSTTLLPINFAAEYLINQLHSYIILNR